MSALYDTSTIGTANNLLTLNDYSGKPVFRVRDTRPGIIQLRQQDVPIPNAAGIADFQTLEGGANWSITGTMYPGNESEYYTGKAKLRTVANLEIAQADLLSDGGYVPYTWFEAGRPKVVWVKILSVEGLGESTKIGYVTPFILRCKIKAPYIYDRDAVTGSTGTAPVGVPAGVGFPLLFPALLGSTTYAPGFTVTNTGDQPAYPTFNIQGPCNRPRITNTTTGEYLEVDVNLATTGDVLTVAYDLDTPPAITVAGTSYYNKLTAGSTFFKVKPGVNTLQYTATSLGTGTQASVSFYNTYSLS